jgi:hypothetical protein
LVEDGIDAAQENTAQYVEVLRAARLNPAVGRTVAEVLERKVCGFNVEEGVADRESDFGERVEIGWGWEDPSLLCGTLFRAGNGAVDPLA